MPNTPTTPSGASSASRAGCTPSGRASGSADAHVAIIEADRALRGIDECYQPSEDEIAAVAGVSPARARRIRRVLRGRSVDSRADEHDQVRFRLGGRGVPDGEPVAPTGRR